MKILFWDISLNVKLINRIKEWWKSTWIAKGLKARSDEKSDVEFYRILFAESNKIFLEGQWPPEASHPEFGLTTKAKPRYGVSQSFELATTVEKMLKRSLECCVKCGHYVGVENHGMDSHGS